MDNPPEGTPTLVAEFRRAGAGGDVDGARRLLQYDPTLARESVAGTTALHLAVDHPEIVRLLLDYGADPNVRDAGDNATPLHHAAGRGARRAFGCSSKPAPTCTAAVIDTRRM